MRKMILLLLAWVFVVVAFSTNMVSGQKPAFMLRQSAASAVETADASMLPPGGTFIDDNGSVHEGSIEAIAALGITKGCNPPRNTRYCPGDAVTRGQMAAFLQRALALPRSNTDYFIDDDQTVFERAINAIAEAGITKGCNPPTNDQFCPGNLVTRGQMAAFLVRALALPDSNTDYFIDDDGSVFESVINTLAAAGITKGCNPPANDRFCPGNPVTRGQMATFLSRALGLSPIIPPPGPETSLAGRVLFEEMFEDADWWRTWTSSYAPGHPRNRTEQIPGYSGRGIEVTILEGSHFGTDLRYRFAAHGQDEPDEVYFRYFIRFIDWDNVSSGKLPGFEGIVGRTGLGNKPSTPEEPGFSARGLFVRAPEVEGATPIGYYVYHINQPKLSGEKMHWDGELVHGDWYCVEGRIALNTPGERDGILDAWVDGQRVFVRGDIEFRYRADEHVRSFWMDIYYGGKQTAHRTMTLQIDELVLATARVGCTL